MYRKCFSRYQNMCMSRHRVTSRSIGEYFSGYIGNVSRGLGEYVSRPRTMLPNLTSDGSSAGHTKGPWLWRQGVPPKVRYAQHAAARTASRSRSQYYRRFCKSYALFVMFFFCRCTHYGRVEVLICPYVPFVLSLYPQRSPILAL